MKAHRDEQTGRWHTDLPDVFDEICQKLKDKVPFTFARYGDGEFNAIYGKKGANCDGHEYFPDLGERLKESLYNKPNYVYCDNKYYGLQPLTIASPRIKQIEKDFQGIEWVDADCIHNASIDGRMNEFFEIISELPTYIIGPKHLKNFHDTSFLDVPSENCWLNYNEVNASLNTAIHHWKDNIVFLLCASMMSEILIDDFKDSGHTFIDMGSVLDPYVGVKSRRYHHKLTI